MANLVDFDEAWNSVPNKDVREKEVHIVLGNGFSIGAHGAFGYDKLYQVAQGYDLPEEAEALFARYGTTDFEKVLYQLHESAWLTREYGYDSEEIDTDYDELRSAFIEAIAEVHPERSWDMDEDQVSRIGKFLERFHLVGSVSYDLVLYWLLMRYMGDVKGHYSSFLDGFGNDFHGGDKLRFYRPRPHAKRIVCYLHGGLHLTPGRGGALKRRWGFGGESLIDQARKAIEKREYPLFVAEGTWQAKEQQIARSGYLTWAAHQLSHARGVLFSYGWSMKEQDEHLLQAIWSNKDITDVWVGVYGQEDPSEQAALQARALRIVEESQESRSTPSKEGKPISVQFYDSSSVSLW